MYRHKIVTFDQILNMQASKPRVGRRFNQLRNISEMNVFSSIARLQRYQLSPGNHLNNYEDKASGG